MRVLVVDDDRVLADLLAFTLRRDGFEVFHAYDGEGALARWADDRPDLIILDVNMPKLDGFRVLQEIRGDDDTPVILLTVRGDEDDIVKGLELGADDYIAKPFSPRQLVARARAVLRRAGLAGASDTYQIGELTLDVGRRQLRIGSDEVVQLTRLENRFLDYLMANAGQVLTTEAIIDRVWGFEGGDRDALRQLVHRIRGKIEPDPANPVYVETVPGLGYGFAVPSPE